MQSLLVQMEILSSTCIFILEFLGITKAKRPNEAIFSKLNVKAFQWRITHVDAKQIEGHTNLLICLTITLNSQIIFNYSHKLIKFIVK